MIFILYFWNFGWVAGVVGDRVETLVFTSHLNYLSLDGEVPLWRLKNLLTKSVLTEEELNSFIELMRSFYVSRDFILLCHRGRIFGNNLASDYLLDQELVELLNQTKIPFILEKVYQLISKEASFDY